MNANRIRIMRVLFDEVEEFLKWTGAPDDVQVVRVEQVAHGVRGVDVIVQSQAFSKVAPGARPAHVQRPSWMP